MIMKADSLNCLAWLGREGLRERMQEVVDDEDPHPRLLVLTPELERKGRRLLGHLHTCTHNQPRWPLGSQTLQGLLWTS